VLRTWFSSQPYCAFLTPHSSQLLFSVSIPGIVSFGCCFLLGCYVGERVIQANFPMARQSLVGQGLLIIEV
jgi:hypothetical protein